MAKPAKAAPEESEAPEKPKSKRLLLAVLALLILGAIGGAAWYFIAGSKHDAPKEAPPPTKAVYMDLEPFTVNLQREESDQFLQVGISLKLPSAKLEEKVTEHLPEIRSRLLFLLSSKRPSELVPVSGKKKLAHDIAMEIDTALGLRALPDKKSMPGNAATDVNAPEKMEVVPVASAVTETGQGAEAQVGGVMEVLFTSFIIQ